MKKVILNVAMSGLAGSFVAGDIVELADDVAQRYIDKEFAQEFVEDDFETVIIENREKAIRKQRKQDK